MQSKQNIQNLFVEIVAALFVFLFLYTATTKTINHIGFVETIKLTPLIAPYTKLLALVVPAAEFFAACLLIVPRLRYSGLIFSTLLMVLFTIYVGFILLSATELPCSCGGVIEAMSWEQHLAFNAGFVLLGCTATLLSRKQFIMINRSSRIPVK